MNYNIELSQIDPACSFTMKQALADHRGELLQMLLAAEAPQQHLFEMRSSAKIQIFELSMEKWEIAVGAGTEAAQVAAKMAGLSRAKDGRWYNGQDGEAVLIEVPQSFLMTYLSDWADTF